MGALVNALRGVMGGKSGQTPAQGTGEDGQDQGTLDKGKRLEYVQERWSDLKNAYIVYHQAIWQSLLFYANQSWIDWDDSRKIYVPLTPSDDWVPRPRINRFSPTVDAVASNLYQIPEVESVANPPDDPDSTMVSEICNSIADYCMDHEGLRRPKGTQDDKAGHAAQLFVLAGTVFSIIRPKQKSVGQKPVMSPQQAQAYTCDTCDQFKVVPVGGEVPKFCPECGNPVEAEPFEQFAGEQDDQGQPKMQEVNEYELSIHIGNPLWAFPRAGAKSLEDTPFFLWAERDTLDAWKMRFDYDAEPDAVWPDGYSVTYEHALSFWYTGYSSSSQQVKDSCMGLEMYVEPGKNRDHPKGFYQVVVNEKTAWDEEWNFPSHPVTMGKYLHLPTIFFARSVGFDLCELQRELNAYESVIKLHSMVAAVDPIVVDANTIVSEITGKSDKVIKWRSIGPNSEPPHRMGSGHLDDGIYKQRDNLHAEFQNISMAVNAFRGEQEGAITAAAAIQQLRGQAELMFGKPVANWNNFWCSTVNKYVKFVQFYFTLEQIAAIVGPGKEQEIQKFKTADLDKVTEWIPSTHGLPRTRDERRQEMMLMWDKGALDVQDPAVRKQLYELFGETGMQNSFNKDATNARLENTAIKNGAGWMVPQGTTIPGPDGQAMPQAMPGPSGQVTPAIHPMISIEDIAVHVYFHKDQIKSPDFKKWPQPAQQALIEHTLESIKALNLEMVQKMQMQAMAAGKGPASDAGAGAGPTDKPGAGDKPGGKSQSAVNGDKGAQAQDQGGE